MLTIIKVFIILFLLKGIGNILAISEINLQALLSIGCPGISLLAQIEGERKAFFEGCKKGDRIIRLLPTVLCCHKR